MSLNITKTGILKESLLNEYHVEPDGSIWEHVFHHENPAVNLFVSSDTFSTGVFKSSQMWFNFNVCNLISGNWELLVFQNRLITDNIIKYRWIQTANPLTCAYGDVDLADITKITTTGYTNFSGNYAGLYKKNSTSYLLQNNGNSSNTWGRVGSWTAYQGGIAGFNGIVVTTGQIDVYIRVDSIVRNAKIYKQGNITVENNFYEY